MSLSLPPFSKPFHGAITVPGSKSITNRVLPLAALSKGEVRIFGALKSEDSEVMLNALRRLGVGIDIPDAGSANFPEVRIQGNSGIFPASGDLKLDCKNSGTTMRFLTALAILRQGKTVLEGAERMYERPIGDLVSALRELGVSVRYLRKEGFPPIEIAGTGGISGSEVTIPGDISSQFVTALLLLAPFAEHSVTIRTSEKLVSRPYVEMTITILRQFGGNITTNETLSEFFIATRHGAWLQKYHVEADATSATYPLSIAAITGGKVLVRNLCSPSIQGDARFSELVLKKMGCDVRISEEGTEVIGPKHLKPLGKIDLGEMPDAAMTAVVLAAYAEGASEITGLSTLRHKESDRIEALASNLQKMGATVTFGDDFITVEGNPQTLHGAEIETYDDHRVAMCFSVPGSMVPGVDIRNPECVGKTYPTYWEEYGRWAMGDGG